MTAGEHHLRYVALCGFLLLLLMVVAWVEGEEVRWLGRSLAMAPFAFVGCFCFNWFQRPRADREARVRGPKTTPSEAEQRIAGVVYGLTWILGLACGIVAVLMPDRLPAVVLAVPALAGSAGIHLEAIM
ncbi:hypothetical protein [Roseateles sp.]|uniref:hypothetical protein n=1 Tax=Roseateles sp. TaxID=1971397 RepID=UPI0039ECDBC2